MVIFLVFVIWPGDVWGRWPVYQLPLVICQGFTSVWLWHGWHWVLPGTAWSPGLWLWHGPLQSPPQTWAQEPLTHLWSPYTNSHFCLYKWNHITCAWLFVLHKGCETPPCGQKPQCPWTDGLASTSIHLLTGVEGPLVWAHADRAAYACEPVSASLGKLRERDCWVTWAMRV